MSINLRGSNLGEGARTGKLERLTGLKDFRRVTFPTYPWSGLTPDGAPLRLRDVGTQEVYALDFEAH
jgi:hypothetical protein